MDSERVNWWLMWLAIVVAIGCGAVSLLEVPPWAQNVAIVVAVLCFLAALFFSFQVARYAGWFSGFGNLKESASSRESPGTVSALDTVNNGPPANKSPGEQAIDFIRAMILPTEEWAPPEGTPENQLKLEFLQNFSLYTANAMVEQYDFDEAVRRITHRMNSEVRAKIKAARENGPPRV